MQNLAGHKEADRFIRRELARARIPIVEIGFSGGEVRYSLIGRLKHLTFTRAWSYWVVKGLVPLDVARRLYEDPVGKEDIRVTGHCGCPPPEGRATWRDREGNILIPMKEKAQFDEFLSKGHIDPKQLEGKRFVERPEDGIGFVESYHIDSEVGLRIFADAVRDIVLPAPFELVEAR